MARERQANVSDDIIRLLDRMYHELVAIEGEAGPEIDALLEQVHSTILAVCPDPIEYSEIVRQKPAPRAGANGAVSAGPGRPGRPRGRRPAEVSPL